MDFEKFLVPKDLTISQFISVIKKRLETDVQFDIICDNKKVDENSTIDKIYKIHKSEDGFLYLQYKIKKRFILW